VAQTMYAHVSKCKNNKRKERKKREADCMEKNAKVPS
jgi:hypothetical protein